MFQNKIVKVQKRKKIKQLKIIKDISVIIYQVYIMNINYYQGKTLGEGTFGKVKQGNHILTGEKVAIKILEKLKIIDVTDVERVSREIHILKLIRHPNIIQLYEVMLIL